VRLADCPWQVNHIGLVNFDIFFTITYCVIHRLLGNPLSERFSFSEELNKAVLYLAASRRR
jgi:hypothetical protein